MLKLTISEAARQIPMSRSKLYSRYINTGVISIEKDEKGRPKIDSSELLRVFPMLQGELSTRTVLRTDDYTNKDSENTGVLEERIKGLEALLAAKEDLIVTQKQQLLFLGFDNNDAKKKKRFWLF